MTDKATAELAGEIAARFFTRRGAKQSRLKRAIGKAITSERAACAKVVADSAGATSGSNWFDRGRSQGAWDAARAVSARMNTANHARNNLFGKKRKKK